MSTTIDADVCIIGAGIAGLFTVWSLPEGLRVVVIDKGRLGEGSSPLAQGGMAAAIAPGDTPSLHLADTIAAGADLVDEDAARLVCTEAPERVRELVDLGCLFDTNADGTLHLAREGGQAVARSVHRNDATGAEMVRALREATEGRFERLAGYALGFAVVDDVCGGVWVATENGTVLVRAPHTLLATGGAGALFASTTNPPASTGDGIGLAAHAGARLTDLEFVQFHPTALAVPESPRPLLTEALRGAGATLVDADGRRFMVDRHPDAELGPRHAVTAGILEAGEAFLDCRMIGAAALEEEFPTVVSSCKSRGFDPATQLLPVAPAAHYLIGGIAVDEGGRSTLPGLFAAGECAATGMHGANRMAGNSLSESVVFAARVAGAIVEDGDDDVRTGDSEWADPPRAATVDPALRAAIVDAVTLGAGPIRSALGAFEALEQLKALDAGGSVEAAAMITAGDLLVRSALAREETRGVHMRSDYPDTDPTLDGVHFTS